MRSVVQQLKSRKIEERVREANDRALRRDLYPRCLRQL